MHDLRYDASGNVDDSFIMNKPEFSEEPKNGIHEIIIGGQNWGSGSSREHAAWAISGERIRFLLPYL
jgi:3-isopropylmalate/(R)-2-methylmalate dehydratase small subunit